MNIKLIKPDIYLWFFGVSFRQVTFLVQTSLSPSAKWALFTYSTNFKHLYIGHCVKYKRYSRHKTYLLWVGSEFPLSSNFLWCGGILPCSQPQALSRFENGNSITLSQEQVLKVLHWIYIYIYIKCSIIKCYILTAANGKIFISRFYCRNMLCFG